MKKTMITSLLACTLAAPVYADKPSDMEVYVGAARYFFDSDRDIDDATSVEGGLEIPVNEEWSFDAWLGGFDTDVEDSDTEFDGRRYTVGGLYHLLEGSYRPFLTAGFGLLEFDASGGDNFDLEENIIYLGAGAKKYFDNNFVLRGDLMAMNSLDEEATDFGVRLALGYAFGREVSKPVAAPAPSPKIQEAPSKPAPVAQEPKPALVAPAPIPAPVDSDNDGVFDKDDKCPGTESIFKVDDTGCPVTLLEKVSINLDVKFKTNSAELTGESHVEIKELADFLIKYENTKTTVEGFTDDRGRAEYNKQLSQRRAEAVKEALVNGFNIDAGRIDAIGYGEEQPIATNDTAEGRAKNRRVVAQIEAQVQEVQKK